MRVGTKITREDTTAESMVLNAQSTLDPEMQAAITDPECGIMKAGLLPAVEEATSAGSKSLLNSICQAVDGGIGFKSFVKFILYQIQLLQLALYGKTQHQKDAL